MKQNKYPGAGVDKNLSEKFASVVRKASLVAMVVLAFSDYIPGVNKFLGLEKNNDKDKTEIKSRPKPVPTPKSIPFSPEAFISTLDSVLIEAKKGLQHYYKTENIRIDIGSHERTFEEQKKLFGKNKSKTVVSLHNYKAAVDINIRIDGKHQSGSSPKSTLPYQIVGYFAKNAGLFWGRAPDAGHIGVTEYTYQLLERYPELIKDSITQQAITLLMEETPLEIKYKSFIDVTKHPYTSHYIPNKGSKRGYLPPINPYIHHKGQ